MLPFCRKTTNNLRGGTLVSLLPFAYLLLPVMCIFYQRPPPISYYLPTLFLHYYPTAILSILLSSDAIKCNAPHPSYNQNHKRGLSPLILLCVPGRSTVDGPVLLCGRHFKDKRRRRLVSPYARTMPYLVLMWHMVVGSTPHLVMT